jgi:hypothetical protein
MDLRADIITTDALLLEMFPSKAEQNLDERRITLTIRSVLSSGLRLRDVANQFRELCACQQARLVIGGKTVQQQVLPIARALRTARHARRPRLGLLGLRHEVKDLKD